MFMRLAIVIVIAALAPAGWEPAPGLQTASSSSARTQFGVSAGAREQPPSDEEIRARTQKVLANQHNDDLALELYERVERHMDRTGGANPRTTQDRTYRVVPTGGGTMKILLWEDGKRVDPADYRRQLQEWEGVLEMMARPNDPKGNAAREKYEKRQRERAKFVDAIKEAFIPKWVRRETYNGHLCDLVELNPNPKFHPHSMFQGALSHVTATIWVDHAADQLVRGEARIANDVSFGGGILGKLYRGGTVSMEQTEVAPGIWLPTRYQYDFSGRKFLFPFEEHRLIEVRHYRRVGPPEEALALVRNEIANGTPFLADP
jgi:hypothetical protein